MHVVLAVQIKNFLENLYPGKDLDFYYDNPGAAVQIAPMWVNNVSIYIGYVHACSTLYMYMLVCVCTIHIS